MATNLTIVQGKTFVRVVRWSTLSYIYKMIIGITNGVSAVIIVPNHGVPDGWRVAVVSVKGMEEINAQNSPPAERDYTKATVRDSNTLELNAINSFEFSQYASGGAVQFYTPMDLAGYTCRMQIKDRPGGTVLASTDIDDAPLNVITAIIDNVGKTITLSMPAAATALFAWKKGQYDIEMVSGTGDVTALLSGYVFVTPEVTTAT